MSMHCYFGTLKLGNKGKSSANLLKNILKNKIGLKLNNIVLSKKV